MAPAERLPKPSLPSLPEELFDDIVYRLDERDTCRLELVCRTFHEVLSTRPYWGLLGRA